MRVPMSWLRELTAVPSDVEDVARVLQDLGLLTEEIHLPRLLPRVVVAEVKECRPIEGAKQVQLVVVDDGETPDREVVCGAFNIGPGDRVPLALPGAELPNGMRIEVRTVKSLGVTSHGMLCAADELAVGDDHAGILLLDPHTPVGLPVTGVLGLDETVLEVEVTPNRPDCMGMIGVAREAAAAYGLEVRRPADTVEASGAAASDLASVEVQDPGRCPRYVAVVVEEVTVAKSPPWLARRLLAAGIRPVNNVVDVTNYVMLETGQPLHAFDLDHLAGASVVVRTARDGEKLTTLDGQERTCRADDLLICDADAPVAIAGIMGGQASEVADTTTRILVESAHFDAASVLATSKRLGLRSEASARFERGVDPGGCLRAARRAAALIADLAGGAVRSGEIDVCGTDVAEREITLRPERVNRILGTDVDASEMRRLLESIEIAVRESAGVLVCTIPTFRVDLTREIDLVEEVARLHGYNSIPRTLPASSERVGGLDPLQAAERTLRIALRASGLDEARTWSFVSDALYDKLGWAAEDRVEILNPLRDEDRYLRTSLVPTLLQAAAYNVARQARSVRLHEIGRVARRGPDVQPRERWRAGILLCGVDDEDPVHGAGGRPFDVFDAKGVVELVGEALGVDTSVVASARVPPGLHPGRCGEITLGTGRIGWLGELHPRVAEALDLPVSTVVAEFDVDPVLAAHVGREERAVAVSAYPATTFDVALVVDAPVPAGDVAATLCQSGGPALRDVRLFDVYRGDQVGPGQKSLAFQLTFQADDRTLRDEDVRSVVDAMIAAAADAHGASLRS